jgi:hypothetical protein
MNIFWWGVVGGAGCMVAELYKAVNHPRPLTVRKPYNRLTYWLIRIALVTFGGALAVAYRVEDPRVAITLGAAAPMVLSQLVRHSLFSDRDIGGESGRGG